MAEGVFSQQTMEREYLSIERFTEEYDTLTYLQLDNYTTQRVNLFALPENESFYRLEYTLDKIIAALPAFKRILSKPITRLKDVTNVLPVEAVRVMNNATMVHISQHTELWGNVTKEGLKPRKLMTLAHEEEYKIYENVLFVRLIDTLLAFVRKNVRQLKDILYSCQPLRFNLLERTNHLMYFLAIGKLHVGYAHAQDEYRQVHQRCLEKLLFIDKTLRARLHVPVYRVCRKDTSRLTLKKTNVFRLQKDYRQVYALWKLFVDKDAQISAQMEEETLPERGYADYCTLLSVFAAGHFNFDFDEKDKLKFRKLNATCTFRGWTLRIERLTLGEVEGLRFRVKKEKEYAAVLFFYRREGHTSEAVQAFARKYPADEYLFAEPSAYGEKGRVYLNLFDVDSFRRIQQIFLRAMVYADEKREACPFCGAPLEAGKEGYKCGLCKTLLRERRCPEHGKAYFTTELKDYKIPLKSKRTEGQTTLFADKEWESVLFYRNITPLTGRGQPACPHCGKSHT